MKDKISNICKKIKLFFTTNTKMKMLVGYLVVNLLYITIGSYIFTTRQLNTNPDYKQFALGMKYIVVLNFMVFLVICFCKRYKKNWAHLGILAMGIVRSGFYVVCI